MRLEEPVGHHAVFGHAIQHAVGADDRRVHRAGQDQEADDHHEAVQQQAGRQRPRHVHGQSADEVVAVELHADFVGNQHHGQEGNARREQQAVDEDDEGRLLEVLHLRRFDFAVDLGQRLFAAHGQDRMPEGQQQADHADDAHPIARPPQFGGQPGEPAADQPQGIFLAVGGVVDLGLVDLVAVGVLHLLRHEFAGGFVLDPHCDVFLAAERIVLGDLSVFDLGAQVGPEGHGVDRTAADQSVTPHQTRITSGHDGRGDHDLQGLVAGLVDADDVLAEEIERDGDGDDDRSPAGEHVLAPSAFRKPTSTQRTSVDDQPHDVLPGRNRADRPGEDVVEHQRRDRELGEEPAHGLLDHAVHAAADEQRAAFDIDRAHAVAEDHHGQDEPRGRRADRPFHDAADVVGRAGQVAEHDGRRPPVGDEREHHAADDDHLDRTAQRICRGEMRRIPGRRTGRVTRHRAQCLAGTRQGIPRVRRHRRPFQFRPNRNLGLAAEVSDGLELEITPAWLAGARA